MQKIDSKTINLWLPVLAYAAVIFAFSSIPGSSIPSQICSFTTFLHFIEYSIFALLLSRAIKNSFRSLTKLHLCIIVTLIASLYGASDEFHQVFVLGRYATFLDFAVDSLGGLIGGLLYR